MAMDPQMAAGPTPLGGGTDPILSAGRHAPGRRDHPYPFHGLPANPGDGPTDLRCDRESRWPSMTPSIWRRSPPSSYPAPGRHLVVGHSNTTHDLVTALGGDPGPPIESLEYDRLYLVSMEEGGVRTILLRFGAPSPRRPTLPDRAIHPRPKQQPSPRRHRPYRRIGRPACHMNSSLMSLIHEDGAARTQEGFG